MTDKKEVVKKEVVKKEGAPKAEAARVVESKSEVKAPKAAAPIHHEPAAKPVHHEPAARFSAAPQVDLAAARVTKKPSVSIPKKGVNGTGRRKKGIARVRLIAGGSGKITINDKPLDTYFVNGFLKLIVNQPLSVADVSNYDVVVNVHGGGLTGQAGAIRHGIARALVKENPQLKPELKKAGFLKRDPRMKERKKYGLKKARRAPQFSKR